MIAANQHITPEDVIRLVDGELSAQDASALNEHASACDDCAALIAKYSRRSAALTRALERSDIPPPAREEDGVVSLAQHRIRRRAMWQRPSLRAAAIIVLLAGVAVATPARAWIRDWIAAVWTQIAGDSDREAPVQTQGAPASETARRAGATVTFAASAATFRIETTARQSAGVLSVHYVESGEVTASASDGSAELLVLPNALRIVNTATSTADYDVSVPRTVRTVVVNGRRYSSEEIEAGVRITVE